MHNDICKNRIGLLPIVIKHAQSSCMGQTWVMGPMGPGYFEKHCLSVYVHVIVEFLCVLLSHI